MTKKKSLHILAFNIPFPANYGGVIDVFYKLIALHKIGINIHLHCFEYGRKHAHILEKYCTSIHYYKRTSGIKHFFSPIPYFVETRASNVLLSRLIEHPFPILSEGIHCIKTILAPELKHRKKYLRAHNIERDYYFQLFKNESHFLNKIYFFSEYLKLIKFEQKAKLFDGIFSISKSDHVFYSKWSRSYHIRAFHSNQKIQSKIGLGKYALYHGNLSVNENIKAALFLIKTVFNTLSLPLIIAGKNPNSKILNAAKPHSHISVIENPIDNQMNDLISEAQMVLLPTNQPTGIKLKLIESLYRGRYCVVNQQMIGHTELNSFCHIANSPKEWINTIDHLKERTFSQADLNHRKSIESIFNNEQEAQKIFNILFDEK